jgi:hypothetical protein
MTSKINQKGLTTVPAFTYSFNPVHFLNDDDENFMTWRVLLERVCLEHDLDLGELVIFEHLEGALDANSESDEFADGLVAWSAQHVIYCESGSMTDSGDPVIRVVDRDPPTAERNDYDLDFYQDPDTGAIITFKVEE